MFPDFYACDLLMQSNVYLRPLITGCVSIGHVQLDGTVMFPSQTVWSESFEG